MGRIDLFVTLFFVATGEVRAAESIASQAASAVAVDTIWVLFASFLVFFMQAGFGLLEAGLTRAKNAINILMKNFMDFCIACILFFIAGVSLLDSLGIDDPVGAVPVHGLNGIWGTVAVGLFGSKALGLGRDGLFYGGGFAQVGIQLLGALAVSLFVFFSMSLVFWLIKKTYGLRVSERRELRGLDLTEHGMESYAGFQVFTTE